MHNFNFPVPSTRLSHKISKFNLNSENLKTIKYELWKDWHLKSFLVSLVYFHGIFKTFPLQAFFTFTRSRICLCLGPNQKTSQCTLYSHARTHTHTHTHTHTLSLSLSLSLSSHTRSRSHTFSSTTTRTGSSFFQGTIFFLQAILNCKNSKASMKKKLTVKILI